MRYVVKYNNDVGPDDDYFDEWWEIVDTVHKEEIAKCYTEEWANTLCQLLNTKS
jgi:hypothetical protein